jgi:hypothetical protein
MTRRQTVYAFGLVLTMAIATLLAAPHRSEIRPLPADWTGPHGSGGIQISLFPNGAIYAGDWMGLQVTAGSDPGKSKLQVRLDSPAASPLAEANSSRSGMGDFWILQWPWLWNSDGQTGWHTLFVSPGGGSGVGPGLNPTGTQYPVQILSADGRPALRQSALWRETRSACCEFYYLSGTESERDLGSLIAETEQAYASITTRLHPAGSKLAVVFLPRLYGQGGLTDGEGILSYLDRNYNGTDFPVVLTHEMVHLVADAGYPLNLRPPAFLNEGWAVYITGGHYRTPEPLQERAAVVYQSGAYVPLATLADSFYLAQHEIAYIEAGAFVEFLVGRFGWEKAYAMFRDPSDAQAPSAALDAMLQTHFGETLARCESDWLDGLRMETPHPDQVQDVNFTIAFFNAMRRYQAGYAPGSNVSAMWIPDIPGARERGITGDYLPSPGTAESIALETVLIEAQRQAGDREWTRAWETLGAIGRVLDAKERRAPDPAAASPLAESCRRLVSAVLRGGYEPLGIRLEDDRAEVTIRPLGGLEKGVQVWKRTDGGWSRVG